MRSSTDSAKPVQRQANQPLVGAASLVGDIAMPDAHMGAENLKLPIKEKKSVCC